ncbi:hypothetical protein CKO44_07670 [Rubrivivax gelatinosus]|nr:hypothetical protein [Rubrivivax gelatinosus]
MGTVEDRLSRAAYSYNLAARLAVEAGYLLLSVKSEVEHGAFQAAIDGLGLSSQRASELMRMAKLTTLLPPEKRAELLVLSKTKVLALASADPEVIEEVLAAGTEEIDALSVRDLRQMLRDTQAALADASVQRDTAEAELQAANKRLKGADRADSVPLVVADLRAEVLALAKKAELAVDAFNPLGVDIALLIGTEASAWADGTMRLAVSALCALRLQLDGVLTKYLKEAPDAAQPSELSYLSKQEVVEAAKRYAELTALHDHEKALREWEAQQKRPRGKGRPTARPVAPEGK